MSDLTVHTSEIVLNIKDLSSPIKERLAEILLILRIILCNDPYGKRIMYSSMNLELKFYYLDLFYGPQNYSITY